MKTIVIYTAEIPEEDAKKNLAHMIGEKLLEVGLKKEYGRELRFEPRDKGEHGKPFFTLLPDVYYNITHAGKYVACAFADQQVGIDIQDHREVSYERVLARMVPEEEQARILALPDMKEEFFRQWTHREAYIKWTGEGLSRDLRTIDLESGWHTTLPVEEGYSAALYAADPHEIRIVRTDITTP